MAVCISSWNSYQPNVPFQKARTAERSDMRYPLNDLMANSASKGERGFDASLLYIVITVRLQLLVHLDRGAGGRSRVDLAQAVVMLHQAIFILLWRNPTLSKKRVGRSHLLLQRLEGIQRHRGIPSRVLVRAVHNGLLRLAHLAMNSR